MGILDGNAVLSRDNGNNNRGGDKKQNNNRNRGNNGSSRKFEKERYGFSRSSYLPDGVAEKTEEMPKKETREQDKRAVDLYEFCDKFAENNSNYRALQDIMYEDLPEVIGYMNSYYKSHLSEELVDAMNKFVLTAATTQFVSALHSTLVSGSWMDDGTYDKIWRSLAFTISIVLETSHERMHEDAITKYVQEILPRMWAPEISEIVRETGVTKDLALDLIIAIPMIGAEWNGANIDTFFRRFLDKMMTHSEDNMDILNHEVQGMLYERFFGKSKTALKVIGKYLVSEPIETFNSMIEEAVYKDFVKMLYEKLDRYDTNEIEYVFNFVAKYRKEHENAKVIYSADQATEFDNVKKGLLATMDDDKDTIKYLA